MSKQPYILMVVKLPDGSYRSSLEGSGDECFEALMCASAHFAEGVGQPLVAVCEKMLEAAENKTVELVTKELTH